MFPGEDIMPHHALLHAVKTAPQGAAQNKDFRLHDIRHRFASKLVQQGCTLYEVAALLGHSSPNTSARYSHLEKKSVAEKAANVLNALNTK
jgi:site-specific recombinase XerD